MILAGRVGILPQMRAPGFICARSRIDLEHRLKLRRIPNVSSCEGIYFIARTLVPYKGYSVSFGRDRTPSGVKLNIGYKARFDAPLQKFGVVKIPFSDFTLDWEQVTGNPKS